jgi:TrmH family RNA methyltransferase
MEQSLGRHHPLIRRIRALGRDGGLRRAEGLFVAEGPHLAGEALSAPQRVELFLVSPRLTTIPGGASLLGDLERSGRPVHRTSDAVLDALQDARSPQPVLALVREVRGELDALFDDGPGAPLVLAAWGVQDPGNLGTLLRSAEAAGARGCFVCGPAADVRHPRAVRASAGAILRLPVLETETTEVLRAAARRGLVALAAVVRGGSPYDACDLTRPLVLVVGGESAGLPEAVLAEVDERVTIPVEPPVESLSVAAAAAILLFEARRQRRTRAPEVEPA